MAEVAFLGRSNVGKSSLLNVLADQEELAFTSARPGCTQEVNFFQIGESLRFVDLPGYGFARVPQEKRRHWQPLVEAYLLQRRALRLSVMVLDARRGWMDSDLQLKDWLESHGRHYIIAATKFDKLKTQKDRSHSLRALEKHAPAGRLWTCSATTGRGVREIWQAITKTIKNQP